MLTSGLGNDILFLLSKIERGRNYVWIYCFMGCFRLANNWTSFWRRFVDDCCNHLGEKKGLRK